MMRGSLPDCCIILGKPDDRVDHVDYVTTLFAFTWPVDKAYNAHTLADQGFDLVNYFGVHGARLQACTKLHERDTATKFDGSCNV